jgi:hypothetical protein
MPVDIQKLFNETLTTGIARHADAARQLGAKYQFNITGDGGGQWFLDMTAGGPTLQAGAPGGADVTLTVAADDFRKLYDSPQSQGTLLFFTGKLKIDGNPALAMKLQKLFDFAK